MRTALLLLAGCSLSKFEYVPCTDNSACQAAFGWGHTCNVDAGLCEETAVEARCQDTWPADLWDNRAAYQDAIVVGALVDTDYYNAEMKAFELPFRQVNENAGLDGVSYALIECNTAENADYDSQTLDQTNTSLATWLASDVGVSAVLGPQYSSDAVNVYTAVEPYGTLVMSHSATSPALTNIDTTAPTDDNPGLFWRTAPPDSLQGAVIAADMVQRSLSRVAVIYQSGAYGEGLAQVFDTEFSAAGGDADLYLFDNDSQRDEAIVAVADSAVDEVLFIASDTDTVAAFLRGAGALAEDYEGRGIFLTDGAYYLDVFEATADSAGDLFDQIRGSRPTVDTEANTYKLFTTAYEAAFDIDPAESAYTAHAYDASWLLIYGAAWSTYQEGGISGLGMARGLRHISDGDEVQILPSAWSTVESSFEEGLDVDVLGASGSLDYDPSTGETTAPIEIWTVSCTGGVCEFGQDAVIQP